MSRFLIICFTILMLTGCQDNLDRTYHPNGQVELIGERINGKKEGVWIQYSEQGDTLVVFSYQGGKWHGKNRFYENGVVSSIWSYKDGIGHGEYSSFYPNGAIESRSFKKNGEQASDVTNYYSTGELKQVMFLNGRTIQYFRNGQVEYEFDNPENGIVTFYDSTGVKQLQTTLINGQMTDTLYQAR